MGDRRVTDAEILAQARAGRALERRERARGLRARAARYDRRAALVRLILTNGCHFAFPPRLVPALRALAPAELAALTLDVGGHVLQWEAQDIDISVPGVLLAAVGPAAAAREVARRNGRVTSPAKAAAARRNGAKGGRPRKRAGATT
jgi:hypothetical protein